MKAGNPYIYIDSPLSSQLEMLKKCASSDQLRSTLMCIEQEGSAVQKCCQVLWALSHLRWTQRQRSNILYTSESKFDLTFYFYVPLMRKQGPGNSKQYSRRYLIWLCISFSVMGFICVTLDAKAHVGNFGETFD